MPLRIQTLITDKCFSRTIVKKAQAISLTYKALIKKLP